MVVSWCHHKEWERESINHRYGLWLLGSVWHIPSHIPDLHLTCLFHLVVWHVVLLRPSSPHSHSICPSYYAAAAALISS